MEIANQKKLVTHILRLLKVSYIDFPIGRTNKGNLAIRFSDQNDNNFDIVLDSVPLSTKDMLVDDNNIELKKMIEKYWFNERIMNGSQFRGTSLETQAPFIEQEVSIFEDAGFKIIPNELAHKVDNGTTIVNVSKIVDKEGNDRTDEFLLPEKKKRGRPAGSKNAKKVTN